MDPRTLVKGKVYFRYGFCDENQTIPKIETIRYVGKNSSTNPNIGISEDYYLFTDPEEEYQRQIAPALVAHGYASPDEAQLPTEIIIPASTMDYIYDIDGVITLLTSLRDRLG